MIFKKIFLKSKETRRLQVSSQCAAIFFLFFSKSINDRKTQGIKEGEISSEYGLQVFPKAKYHLDKFHVSHILSARMSSRPMGWSKAGAYRIARLRAFYFNGGDFRDVVTNQPKLSESGRENTKEKYSGVRFNISNDGQPNLSDYPLSGHVVGIDGLTDKYSSILRAIIRNKKNLF